MAGQNQVHTAGVPVVEAARDLARPTSLDAFRGLVILTMIFVNFLAGVSGIPPWAKHMPGKVDGYTFVDLVFPGFLFIVGVAIPLAQQNRRRRGDSPARLLGHIASRTAGLLFLGVILVNEETFSTQATGMSKAREHPPAGLTAFKGSCEPTHVAAVCGCGLRNRLSDSPS